jgi:hypothetical protein
MLTAPLPLSSAAYKPELQESIISAAVVVVCYCCFSLIVTGQRHVAQFLLFFSFSFFGRPRSIIY